MSEVTHSIVIDRLATRCRVLAEPEAAGRIRVALDAALGERLPAALAKVADLALDGLDGVIRIRRLNLRLDLGDMVEPGGIAELLAEQIASALRRALAGGSGDVRVWPDRDAYLAEYLAMRSGLRPCPAWPFEDLAKLDHLPAKRAAAETIRLRPAVLAPLARLAAATGAPEAVVAGWPEEAQAALVAALLRPDPARAELAALDEALELLAPLVARRPIPRTAGAVAAAALRLALALLAEPRDSPPPRAAVIAAVALLAAWTEVEARRAGRRPRPAGSRSVRERATLLRARDLVEKDPARRTRLATLISEIAARAGRPPPTPDADGGGAEERPEAPVEGIARATPFAGLSLLMPSVLALGASETLGETGLAQAIWQCLDPEDREVAAADPALALLYPVDPREIDLAAPQPAPPERLVETLAEAARPVCEATDPGLRWSALLMGDFASRLRGLHASSHRYLRHQFLRRPGTILRDADTVIVRLEPLPLAVVLRMAGHGMPPPLLPQLGRRRLVLDFGDRR